MSGRLLDPASVANSVRENVGSWLEERGEVLSLGRFRFCRSRRVGVPRVDRWVLNRVALASPIVLASMVDGRR